MTNCAETGSVHSVQQGVTVSAHGLAVGLLTVSVELAVVVVTSTMLEIWEAPPERPATEDASSVPFRVSVNCPGCDTGTWK